MAMLRQSYAPGTWLGLQVLTEAILSELILKAIEAYFVIFIAFIFKARK